MKTISTDSGEVCILEDAFDVQVVKVHAETSDIGALDIETTWMDENPWSNPPDLVSVAITFDGTRAFVVRGDSMLLVALHPILKYKNWIMHNGLFDRLIMKQFFDVDTPLKHDTMAMQYLLNPDSIAVPKSLEACSERYLGLKGYKDVDYENIEDESFEKVAKMNGEDTLRTYNLVRPLGDLLNEDPALSRVYQWIIMPAINELIELTINGIPIDTEALAKVTEDTEAEAADLLVKLRGNTPLPWEEVYPKGWPKPSKWRVNDKIDKETGEILAKGMGKWDGLQFNPGSTKQVQHIIFDQWELPILEWNTDDDGEPTSPSTNADVLLRLETYEAEGDQQDWLHQLRSYRKVVKLLSYYRSWPGFVHQGWLHPRYKPLHVVTGRLSAEKPNIMQVPRQKHVRSVFRAPEGYAWMKADYSQIELRLAALAAQEERMLEAYHNGDDIHRLTATLVLGDSSDDARQVGKTLNFGLLYGGGAATLQRVARNDYNVFLSLDQARGYRDNFFRAYPGLERWHQRCEAEIEATGQSRSPLGRIRYLPKAKWPRNNRELWPQKMAAIREGINHRIQSFASDLLLTSLISLAPVAREYGAIMVAEVHDEMDFVVPLDVLEGFAGETRRIMEDTSWLSRHGIKLGVPVVAEVEAGPSWGEVKELTV